MWIGRYGVIGLMVLLWGFPLPSQAMAPPAPEQMQRYAQLYPDFFVHPQQGVSGGGRSHGRAVHLLVESYHGSTNVEELSAVLRPHDRPALKPESQIKLLLAGQGLSWEDYTRLTHCIASTPSCFDAFLKASSPGKLQTTVIQRARTESDFFQELAGNMDHQVIVQTLLKTYR